MKRRGFLKGLTAAVSGVFGWPDWARAFGLFQINGASTFVWAAPTSVANSASGSATSLNITLPNITIGDIVCVGASCNGGPVASVTSAHLTFIFQAQGQQSGALDDVEMWTAIAASTLVNEVITVTQTSGPTNLELFALSQSGANALHPFDTNSPISSNNALVTFNTALSNVMAVVQYRLQGSTSPTPGAGWTAVPGSAGIRSIMEWFQFNSPQTGRTATISAVDPGGSAGVLIAHDPPPPPVVSFQSIDGGNSYYSTGYFNGATTVPFSYAAASLTYSQASGGSHVYTAGWDDPFFYPIANFQVKITLSSTITMYHDLNWNHVIFLNSDTTLSLPQGASLSMTLSASELFNAGGGSGILPFNGLSTPPSSVVALGAPDEPSKQICISNSIAGIQMNQDGTPVTTTPPSNVVITNAIQDGRLWYTGFSLATQTAGTLDSGGSQITLTALMTQTYPTPNFSGGSPVRRGTDYTGFDAYSMSPARRAIPMIAGNYGNGQTQANLYFNGGSPSSYLQMARASHMGDWVDYFRQWAAPNNLRPIITPLQLGNGRTTTPYEISSVEINWEAWTVVIHGGRLMAYFDHGDATSWVNNDPFEGGQMAAFAYTKATQTVSFTGSITVSLGVATLTIAAGGVVSGGGTTVGHLQPGMQITTGAGAAPFPTIAAQSVIGIDASFTASWPAGTGDVIMTVSGVTGTIPNPAILEAGSGGVGTPLSHDACIIPIGATPPQYNITHMSAPDNVSRSGQACIAYCPGLSGSYILAGYTGGNVTNVSMVATEPDNIALGSPPTSGTNNHGTGTHFNQLATTCAMITGPGSLAPLINAQFAIQYILKTSPQGYIFPSNTGLPGSTIPRGNAAALAYGQTTIGADCCAKHFTGTPYTANTGDTISVGYYIICTTRNQETDTNITITFTLNDPLVTSITVIGEGRSITLDSLSFDPFYNTTTAVFHDTFAFAWTVHVYRINH